MDVHPVKTTSVVRNSLLKNTGGTRRNSNCGDGSRGKQAASRKLWGESHSFESLLELCLNQRTVIQCDVVVFFWHAAFSHERMLHLELERAMP